MEIFKDINGYEGYYQISNYGRVKTLHNRYKNCIFRKPFVRKDGYVVIILILNKKQTTFYLHKLVAGHFIEQNFDVLRSEVNHIDGNKQNNNVNNLEWCTSSYNSLHSCKTGLSPSGSNRPSSKLTESMVYKIPEMIKNGFTIKSIAKEFNVSTTSIHHILNGRNFRCLNIDFGYTFKKYNNKDNTEISKEIKDSLPS